MDPSLSYLLASQVPASIRPAAPPSTGLALKRAQNVAKALCESLGGETALVLLSPGSEPKGDQPRREAGYAVRVSCSEYTTLDALGLLDLLRVASRFEARLTVRASTNEQGEDILVVEVR
jgi:hypothetical protein